MYFFFYVYIFTFSSLFMLHSVIKPYNSYILVLVFLHFSELLCQVHFYPNIRKSFLDYFCQRAKKILQSIIYWLRTMSHKLILFYRHGIHQILHSFMKSVYGIPTQRSGFHKIPFLIYLNLWSKEIPLVTVRLIKQV